MLRVLMALLLVTRCAAIDFDRSASEYIDMGVVSAHALTSEHSITVGFRPESISAGVSYNLLTAQDGGTSRTWSIFTNANVGYTARASSGGDSSGGYLAGETSDGLSGGTIYVIGSTFSSGTDARLYRDASLSETDSSVASTDNGGTEHTMFGASWDSGSPTASYMDGEIFFGIIHDSELTVDEVVEENTTWLPARIPVSWYRPDLNGATGSSCSGTVYDEADTAADGTCTNTPTYGEIPEGRTLR